VIRVRRWAAAIPARTQSDQGDTSIQMAIVFPFVILLTITVVQASMWYYARNIALTAAREGVSAGRAYQADTGDGTARAREVLDRIAGDSLRNPAVNASGSTATEMQVTVSGTAPSMIPGISGLRVSQSASGARERWTTP
jgi:hypothetical protein